MKTRLTLCIDDVLSISINYANWSDSLSDDFLSGRLGSVGVNCLWGTEEASFKAFLCEEYAEESNF